MTSAQNPLHDFMLTPQQQGLLFAALNANRSPGTKPSNSLGRSPATIGNSPHGADSIGFQESPYLDYDLDFGAADSSFDFSFDDGNGAKMIGDLPGSSTPKSDDKSESPEGDSPDKRSHPDDEDDDEQNGGGKRRESDGKVHKKPGRKPLMTEPSSKRKAQNRAAQRAFRERKEKHLKDLETKVEELEKASQTTSSENDALRAKVERMTVELNEYKKRITLLASSRAPSQGPPKPFGQPFVSNINDVNFQFEFPKFGALPGPSVARAGNKKSASSPSLPLNRANSDQLSPLSDNPSPANSSSYSQVGLDSQAKEDLASFSASLFSPPLTNANVANASRASADSNYGTGGAASTSSPSASSNSNAGASSSCGTSPEPSTQSPMGFKPLDTMATIGEETNGNSQDFGHFANMGLDNLNWLPDTNFEFNPQLFGDYREPQQNVLSLGYDDSFFNDAFDVDFTTPYNLPMTAPAKTDLIATIDAAKDAEDVSTTNQLLTCNKIWERLQSCPKVQTGDFDLDGLCSDLQKKAKCSGSGAVVDEKDFKNVMQKYLGKSDDPNCSINALDSITAATNN